jgi:Fe-S cluster biogenesis protein NfuA
LGVNSINQSTINDQNDLNHQTIQTDYRHKGDHIMKEKVEAALQKVRPMLQADGGDVELVDVQGGVVTVRLRGACGGCPMSQMTLKNGIERILKQEVPGVVAVESAP